MEGNAHLHKPTLMHIQRREGGVYHLYSLDLARLLDCDMPTPDSFIRSIPFADNDTTAGTETELQAAVIGRKDGVDLSIMIEKSNYYANIMRRTVSGDAPKKLISDLDRFLNENPDQVWENSYIRFPRSSLSSFADAVFRRDLKASKDARVSELRTDAHKFLIEEGSEAFLRIPVSYLLKLALADVISHKPGVPRIIQRTGYALMSHFTNDNTSPETHSFHVVRLNSNGGSGRAVAKDIARRFLLSQLLVMYANNKFLLNQHGQQAILYFSPHPPLRQKKLNACMRQIRYWEKRPMPEDLRAIVSPADARVLVGTISNTKILFIKEKFFKFEQLLGRNRPQWLKAFAGGDFAIFRLTPDKYYYNHTPVAGKVVDFYEIPGSYHSCNPGAIVIAVTPYSMNKRVVTIFDTDVPGGSQVGLVAMIEVVALMIGEIVQCYSEENYNSPRNITRGMFVEKGVPKSLYLPGSSTDMLIFQKDRIHFAEDIVRNKLHWNAQSRFTLGFGASLVETDVKVRSLIARPANFSCQG